MNALTALNIPIEYTEEKDFKRFQEKTSTRYKVEEFESVRLRKGWEERHCPIISFWLGYWGGVI